MRHVISLVIMAIMIAGCGPQIRVYSDHDPDYQIRNFKTFDWGQKADIEKDKNPLLYNELNDKRIKAAVVKELTNLGFTHTAWHPDLIIHYHIIVDDQSVVTTEPYGYFYGPYWTRTRTHVYSYREGTLIIDLMDAKTNNLIWRGWATADLNTITEDQTEEVINRAVEKIFRRFPPAHQDPDRVLSKTR